MSENGAEIDSEAKKNEIVKTSEFDANHCLVVMEQGPIRFEASAPRWRISASLLLHNARVEANLPFVTIPPLVHVRQIVAIAKVPMRVMRWTFRFESDDAHAKALVWVFPGFSPPGDCGIFTIPHPSVGPWTKQERAT